MKLTEITLSEEQLHEISVKGLINAGIIAAAALGVTGVWNQDLLKQSPIYAKADNSDKQVPKKTKAEEDLEKEISRLTAFVTDKYHVPEDQAKAVVVLAQKNAKPTFPKAQDILAIVGIESAFKPNAVSKLKKDPAVGLMQVRPKAWGVSASSLNNDAAKQIELGTEILHSYYTTLDDEKHAVQAYNIGLTAFKKGVKHEAENKLHDKYVKLLKRSEVYLAKYHKAKAALEG